MNRLLLLGAGFSHNWNAPLARELMGNVLGRVSSDVHAHLLEFANGGGFEEALYKLQEAARSQREEDIKLLANLEGALRVEFANINEAVAGSQFEFSNQIRYSVEQFLARFEAIFTLNQDILLESKYNPIAFPALAGVSGVDFSGLRKIKPQHPLADSHLFEILDPSQFAVARNSQPIFKLHGSSNWQSADGSSALVFGGGKRQMIEKTPILKWYNDHFVQMLSQPDTRLVTIGYSFKDDHINDNLISNGGRADFHLFIIDPIGKALILPVEGQARNFGALPSRIGGESTRLISRSFGGSDSYEFGKIDRFLKGV